MLGFSEMQRTGVIRNNRWLAITLRRRKFKPIRLYSFQFESSIWVSYEAFVSTKSILIQIVTYCINLLPKHQ